MHDSPPPYPGINPNYTPTYPTQPNGFGGQQPPQMGFQAAGGGGAPPSYPGAPGGNYPSGPQAPTGTNYPQAPGPSYPNLPQNGFAGGFQPGASAPSSKLKTLRHFLYLY